MNKEWIVLYVNINSWDNDFSRFDNEEEAREFVNERLEIQKEYEYLSDKVWLFPPNSSVAI